MDWRRAVRRRLGRTSALTSADVSLVYRSLLSRTPSDGEVAWQVAATSDWRALLGAVAASDEFDARVAANLRRAAAPTGAHVNIWHPDLSRFVRPPGTWSADGEVVVGKDGWLFLGRGTNSVMDQYQPEFSLPADWAERWTEVVRVRRDDAAELGIGLLLLVVPDKLSVLSDFLPDDVTLRTRPPADVLSRDLDLGIVYPIDELTKVEGGAYLRTDTHLSLAGNAALGALVLAELAGPTARAGTSSMPTVEYATSGDLGQRFDPPVVEIVSTHNALGGALITEDNREAVAAVGKHVGTRRVLRNTSSADARTVVVFGDSYNFPATHYQSPAWYLAQHFREVHFVWSPFGWDRGYVERVGAELAVCETAERFVPRPPEIRIDVSELEAAATTRS